MQREYGRSELEKNPLPQLGIEPTVVVHPARSLINISTSLSELLLICCVKKCRSEGVGYFSRLMHIRRTNKSSTGYPEERFGGFTQLYQASTEQ
jgi:hypothetical protein